MASRNRIYSVYPDIYPGGDILDEEAGADISRWFLYPDPPVSRKSVPWSRSPASNPVFDIRAPYYRTHPAVCNYPDAYPDTDRWVNNFYPEDPDTLVSAVSACIRFVDLDTDSQTVVDPLDCIFDPELDPGNGRRVGLYSPKVSLRNSISYRARSICPHNSNSKRIPYPSDSVRTARSQNNTLSRFYPNRTLLSSYRPMV